MQLSSTPTAYGGGEAQRLLSLLLQRQGSPTGQDLPAAGQASTAASTPSAQPASSTSAAQFTADTLSSLLSAQEAPPSSSDVAAKLIGTADTNGDGALSLDEVESALGQDTTSGADALSQAFAKVDANGDGQLSAGELSSALDAQNSASVAQNAPSENAHRAHAHHHAHQAVSSSADMASQMLGAVDSNGDGQLSASELSTAIDAFRTANQRGGWTTPTTAQSSQVVTA